MINENVECYIVPKEIVINKRDWIRYKDRYEILIHTPKITGKNLVALDIEGDVMFTDMKVINNSQVVLKSPKRLKLVLKYKDREVLSQKESNSEWEEITEIFQNAIKRLELTTDELNKRIKELQIKQ